VANETIANKEELNKRPKTSRGCSNPSPDQFTSYVIPSPPLKRQEKVEDLAVWPVNPPDENNTEVEVQKDSSTSKNNFVSLLQERDVFLGCWLFGSLLRT
jgi:hypothetical protein